MLQDIKVHSAVMMLSKHTRTHTQRALRSGEPEEPESLVQQLSAVSEIMQQERNDRDRRIGNKDIQWDVGVIKFTPMLNGHFRGNSSLELPNKCPILLVSVGSRFTGDVFPKKVFQRKKFGYYKKTLTKKKLYNDLPIVFIPLQTY